MHHINYVLIYYVMSIYVSFSYDVMWCYRICTCIQDDVFNILTLNLVFYRINIIKYTLLWFFYVIVYSSLLLCTTFLWNYFLYKPMQNFLRQQMVMMHLDSRFYREEKDYYHSCEDVIRHFSIIWKIFSVKHTMQKFILNSFTCCGNQVEQCPI